MTKKILNIHVLYSFAGGNPNRDDTGTPKSLFYGGKERGRISSQAMTRPKRLGYEKDPMGERSYRSKLIPNKVMSEVLLRLNTAGKILTEKEKVKIAENVLKSIKGLTAKEGKVDAEALLKEISSSTSISVEEKESITSNGDEKEAKDTLVWLAEAEIEGLILKMVEKYLKDSNESSDSSNTIDPSEYIRKGKTASLAIAAFGRMFASRPDLQNEAAIQRSHAFTTHEMIVDLDYFTAVDDLRQHGAGHLGLKQLTGGVYYWHANIDRDQLLEVWDIENVETALNNLVALVHSLLNELPTGNQTTSAHHGLPVAVLVVEATQAVSLQTAFETPVKGSSESGHINPSLEALKKEQERAENYSPDSFGSQIWLGTHVEEGTSFLEAAQAIARWVISGELK